MKRSFSWTGQNRRMGKDHERVPETGEALLYVGNEPLDGEEIGSLMRLFGRFLKQRVLAAA